MGTRPARKGRSSRRDRIFGPFVVRNTDRVGNTGSAAYRLEKIYIREEGLKTPETPVVIAKLSPSAEATALMSRLRNAYEVLSDPDWRAAFEGVACSILSGIIGTQGCWYRPLVYSRCRCCCWL